MSLRIPCEFPGCGRTYKNVKTLKTHTETAHLNNFMKNGNTFTLNQNVKNVPKNLASHLDFEREVKLFTSAHKSNFVICSLNTCSLTDQKFAMILFMLDEQLIDIFVLNETWLNKSHDESLFQHSSYQTFRRDRGSRGGGVMVFVKNSIANTLNSLMIEKEHEIISFTLKPTNSNVISIIACYRPPYTKNEVSFFPNLKNLLQKMI